MREARRHSSRHAPRPLGAQMQPLEPFGVGDIGEDRGEHGARADRPVSVVVVTPIGSCIGPTLHVASTASGGRRDAPLTSRGSPEFRREARNSGITERPSHSRALNPRSLPTPGFAYSTPVASTVITPVRMLRTRRQPRAVTGTSAVRDSSRRPARLTRLETYAMTQADRQIRQAESRCWPKPGGVAQKTSAK